MARVQTAVPTTDVTHDQDLSDAGGFDHDLRTTLAALRASLSDLLATLGPIHQVHAALTRDVGIDKTLAAKLVRVVREPDCHSAALDVPGDEGMRIFRRAMQAAGASEVSLELLRESFEAFQEMIRTHCGDRATLDMLAATSVRNSDHAASAKQKLQIETFRKHLFRGASAVFGVQAQVQISASFLTPTRGDSERYDVSLVNGLVKLRRIRSDVAWAIISLRTLEQDGTAGPVLAFEPIDPSHQDGKDVPIPLLRPFCTTPLPELRIADGPNHVRRVELPEGPVGFNSAITLFTGLTYRSASPRIRTDDADRWREHFTALNTPAELAIHDLYIHRDMGFARFSESCLYSQLPGAIAYPNGPRTSGLLQHGEPLQDLSSRPVQPFTADVPGYDRVVAHTVERLGFGLDDFHGLRIRLRFPPVPSIHMYRYELPG
jgi:hypothetical protein